MSRARLRILHAIHDFLPHHQAGSEIYAADLCRAQVARGHHVSVLCAEFNPQLPHGHVTWRTHRGLPVAEISNNWIAQTFEDTYRSPVMRDRIDSVLHAVQPDVVHVHNLLNLSFDLPDLAHARNSAVVATLHDYTLVCTSGGQRIHTREAFVCHEIDTTRCARCFGESPLGRQAAFGQIAGRPGARGVAQAVRLARRVAPRLVSTMARQVPGLTVSAGDVEERLAHARQVFNAVDLFVSPSASLASEYRRLGLPASKIRVSDYGFTPIARAPGRTPGRPLRIGFVGTLVWHKGVHVLVDAVRQLAPDAYTLSIFGDTAVFPDYVADLRAQSAGLPVHFLGGFEPGHTPDVYERLDVLVVPSLWLENSPLVIHEAFMAGVPVLGARIGGIPDLIDEGLNGLLFEAGSAAQLAALLQRLIDAPALVSSLGGSISPVKSIARDAEEWETAYLQVLADRDASSIRSPTPT